MTKSKRICVSIAMILVFAATTLCTAFIYPARGGYKSASAQTTATMRDVTDEYASLAYDTDKYASHVTRLSDAASKEDYVTLIADLGIETIADAAGDEAVSEMVGSARYNDTAKTIRSAQNKLLRAFKKAGIDYKVEARYDTVLAGFAVEIATEDFDEAEKLVESFGGSAMISEKYYLEKTESSASAIDVTVNDVNVHETGIFDSSNVDYDGSGVVVAVLDSGFDYTHTAFISEKAMPSASDLAMTRSDVAARLPETKAYALNPSLTAADVYVSDKIPYAYDYADQDADVYPLESEHGTHVASIIAGADDVITGVAPKAQLALMKVFSDVDDGAKQSHILRAVEDCVTMGVDVMNMSLGMDCGFAREDDEKRTGEIYDSVREMGISLICAASNAYNSTHGSEANGNLPLTSNPDSATVGSPSTYGAALSVASISGVKTPYMVFEGQPIYYLEANDSSGKSYDFVDMMLKGNESASFQYVTVPGIGDSYSGLDVRGKIALVRRGRTTFEEKVQAAYRAGAVGVIIYNNVSGDIRMSVGNYLYDWGLGCVSMSQDDGEKLAAKSTGVIKLSKNYLAGPFMSDFSSWGPTPDLGIKPEITAHGGDILAAIPGQSYDRLSGTSMASPNQAGVHALVRQHIIKNFDTLFPGIQVDSVAGRKAIAATANQLLMTTTDIAYNEFGNPYSVRKQGSGLANLLNAVTTQNFLTVDDPDGEEGAVLDRTKIELGDDPEKTGVYTLEFNVKNISADKAASFDVSALVYTESVSTTLTDKDKTVSSERAYMLGDTGISVSGNAVSGKQVTVQPGKSEKVTVTLTLTSSAKDYLDRSFENGMYVEGFAVLTPVGDSNGGIKLNVPFLAFYGDWTVAPIFDLTYFETNPDEINDAIDDEDKIKPDAYSTRPVGGFQSDYLGFLGAYYFQQNPTKVQIPAQENHIALTNHTGGLNTVSAVWAGMLRAAKTMDITISDATTGRQVYKAQETNQRKSRSYGSGVSPSAVDIKWSVGDANLKNNTEYTVRLDAKLDYVRDGADTNLKNYYEFTFMTDFEAPKITDVRYYSEYDDVTKQTKLFADIDVYDNHYAMALRIGTWNGRKLVEEDYPTPVYGEKNSVSTVTVELNDWIKYTDESYGAPGTFLVFAYDYAMNTTIYELTLPKEVQQAYFEENEVYISQYETKNLTPLIYPTETFATILDYESEDESIARVVDGTILGLNPGTTKVYVSGTKKVNSETGEAEPFGVNQAVTVHVLGPDDPGYQPYDKPIVKSFELKGYHTDFAYYERYSDERHIGITGDEVKFVSRSLTMYPGESVTLRWDLVTYFDTRVEFSTNDDRVVKADPKTGKITAMGEGAGVITAEVLGTNGMYKASVSIEVLDPYESNAGAYLTAYRGIGEDCEGNVVIPTKLNLVHIDQFAFSRPKSVDKDTEPTDEDPYYTTTGPVGEQRPEGYRIKTVVLPEGIEVIGRYAFAYMTSLEKIYLPSTLRQINAGAFEGCTALESVIGLENVKIISKDAFRGCSSLDNTKRFATEATREFRLDEAIALGAGAFAGTAIKSVELPKVQSAGIGAFENCLNLTEVAFAEKIKIDSSIFKGCTSLTSISVNAPVISDEAFAGCRNLTSVTLGADVAHIGARAFAGTKVASFTVSAANPVYETDSAKPGLIYEKGGKKVLAAVAPAIELTNGTLTLPSTVQTIANGAFSCVNKLESIVLNNGTVAEDYAFYGCSSLKNVQGTLAKVGSYAFAGTSLERMPELSAGCEIGVYAFAVYGIYAPEFTKVTVPAGSTVGEGAFYGCRAVTSAEIGSGATVGTAAFLGCSALSEVTFGTGVAIGDMAFYNCGNLVSVTGSQNVTAIGIGAFRGDSMNTTAKFTSFDLSGVASVGAYAFAGNRALTEVTVSDKLKTVGAYAFAGDSALAVVNGDIKGNIGAYAFNGTAITSFAGFASANSVGAYAFANSAIRGEVDLTDVKSVGVGAFEGTSATKAVLPEGATVAARLFKGVALTEIVNLDKALYIYEEAFYGAKIESADLSAAIYVGKFAFAHSDATEVILGENLADLGDNPFAYAPLKLFECEKESDDVFAMTYKSHDFDISETVKVIDGALYTELATGGMELVTYPLTADRGEFTVAEGTVRIADYAAAANTSIVSVNLPYSLKSVGHSAFDGCENLTVVNFGSIAAPVLEAQFDAEYAALDEEGYNAVNAAQNLGDNLPKYVTLYNSSEVDVLFNTNFVGHAGVVKGLTMTYPKNGTGYNSFILDNYFSHKIVTATVANDMTRSVIAMIDALPQMITLADEEAVAAARLAYGQISDAEQVALVHNLETLTAAERTIDALKNNGNRPGGNQPAQPEDEGKKEGMSGGTVALIVLVVLFGAGLIAVAVLWQLPNIKKLIARISARSEKSEGDGDAKRETSQTEEKAEEAPAEETAESDETDKGAEPATGDTPPKKKPGGRNAKAKAGKEE